MGRSRELAELAASYDSGNLFGMKNRIINGAMVIDQRNAGASVTPASAADTYVVDRFSIYSTQASKTTAQQNQGSVTPPAGFKNYLGVTSSSAYSVGASDLFGLFQNIEGFNVADLGWGTSSAQTVTLSFWVRSSLTGSFGGGIDNSAQDRAYPFSYTINSANTWEYKTITIAGDQSGTWLTTNGRGITICWSLGMGSNFSGTANSWQVGPKFAPSGSVNVVGTNGATFYITGVQLEKGTTATSFDYRPYGTELALCQRYYNRTTCSGEGFLGLVDSSTSGIFAYYYPVEMRSSPTLETSGVAGQYQIRIGGVAAVICNAVPTIVSTSTKIARLGATVASGLTVGQCVMLNAQGVSMYLGFVSEL